MALEIVATYPIFYLIIAFGILATIAWIFSLVNGAMSVFTPFIKKSWQSKNELAIIPRFCSSHRVYISNCVFYACFITFLFSQNAFSYLNLEWRTFSLDADNLTLSIDIKSFRYHLEGPEKLLQQEYPNYLAPIQFLECMNAPFLLNRCLNLKGGPFSRSRSFYFLLTACAMLLWLCSWFGPTFHYSAPYDISKTQHSLFQVRYWIFRIFGQDSKFSPDMQVEFYTNPKPERAFFIARGHFGVLEIIISVSFSLFRFMFRFLVISVHLDYVYRAIVLKVEISYRHILLKVEIDHAFRRGQIDYGGNGENLHQINTGDNHINNEGIMGSPTKEDPGFILYHDKEGNKNCRNVPNDEVPNSKSELPSDCSTPKAHQNVNSLRSDQTQDIIDSATYRSGRLASSSPFAEVSFDFGISSEVVNSKVTDLVHVAADKAEPQQQHYESCDTEQPAGVGNLVTVKSNIEDNKLNTAVLPPPIVDFSSSSIYSDIDGDDLQASASALPPNSAPGIHDFSELKHAHDDSFDQNVANYCKNLQNDSCSQTSPDGAYTSYSTVRPEPSTMRNSRIGFPSNRPKQAPPRPQRLEEEMSFPSIEGILVDPALQTLQYGKMNVRVVSARKPDY